MSPEKRKANEVRRLAAQLQNDLETALDLAEQINDFAGKVSEFELNADNPYIYAVAVSLQHYYTALETAFKRVVKEMEGELPGGESWHQDLLEAVCLEIEKVRPELVSKEIRKELDRLRRFRHIVRHGYEYEFDWEEMYSLVEITKRITPTLEKDFTSFINFLKELAQEIERE